MSGTILITGLGLIGSSLGRALKAQDAGYHIIGADLSPSVVDKALALGIMDEGTCDPASAADRADIIILCTPPSAYGSVVKSLAPRMKPGAILTEVGSCKAGGVDAVLAALSPSQRPFFVPGHPIAGTEKSGPEAGFATLFDGAEVVLTPLLDTDKAAIAEVTTLWEKTGAYVVTMEQHVHDHIYANVSHNVQALSYAFGLMLDGLEAPLQQEITAHTDDNFRKFLRLLASDPTMWRDVFLFNKTELQRVLTQFSNTLFSIETQLITGEKEALRTRLNKAKEVRLTFREHISPDVRQEPPASGYGALSDDAFAVMDILPRLIACAIMEHESKENLAHAAGSGFHGFTRNIILNDAQSLVDMMQRKDSVVEALKRFLAQVDGLLILLDKDDPDALYAMLEQAQSVHGRFVG